MKKNHIVGSPVEGRRAFRTSTGWTELESAAKRFTKSAALGLRDELRKSGFPKAEAIEI